MSTYRSKVNVETRQPGDNVCILDVGGELTAFAEDTLMAAYNRACSSVRSVILNFDRLEYMSSSGIGLLVTLLIRAQRQQQRLFACGLSEHYTNIFEITRLNEAIVIYTTEAEALSAASATAQTESGWRGRGDSEMSRPEVEKSDPGVGVQPWQLDQS